MTTARPTLIAAASAVLCACSGGTSLSEAQIASALTTASGVACAPEASDVAECAGKAAGDACTDVDGDRSSPGTCRLAVDGTTLDCARTPPAPPSFLTDPCTSKASGDACTATLPNGHTLTGVCGTFPNAPAGTALACERVRTPPAEATAACATLAANAACSFTLHGYAITGTCISVPGASALACSPGCGQMDHGGHGCDGDHGGGRGHGGGGMGGGGPR